MGFLYKGNTRIGKIHVKTTVNTDYITAGASDILSGKKSIDKNYNPITGTMTITDSLASLTPGTATASDIDAGKTLWVNGNQITGTAVRPGPSSFLTGITEEYPVDTDQTINAGDFVKIVNTVVGTSTSSGTTGIGSAIRRVNDGETVYGNAIALSDNRVLTVFRDNTNLGKGTAIVNNVNDFNMTINAKTAFSTGAAEHISALKLSDEKVLVVYKNNSNNYGSAQILTIAGNVVSYSSVYNITTSNIKNTSLTKLSDNKVLVTYLLNAATSSLTGVVLTINSDNSISAGTPTTITSGTVTSQSVVAIDDTKAIVAYSYYINSTYGAECKILTISGSSITMGSGQTFNSVITDSVNLVKLTNARYVLSYNMNPYATGQGIARVITYDGTNITFGNTTVFNNSTTYVIGSCRVNANKVVVAYRDATNYNLSTGCVLVVNNKSITAGSEYVIDTNRDAASSQYYSMALVSPNKIFLMFGSASGSFTFGAGTLMQVNTDNNTISRAFATSVNVHEYRVRKTASQSDVINGVASESGTAGKTIKVIIPNI